MSAIQFTEGIATDEINQAEENKEGSPRDCKGARARAAARGATAAARDPRMAQHRATITAAMAKEAIKKMSNKIRHEMEQKLMTIADRVVFVDQSAMAMRADEKMDPEFWRRQVAEVLGVPYGIVDCGRERDRRPCSIVANYIWASLRIDDYRREATRPISRKEYNAGLVSLGALIERRMKGNKE